MLQKCFITDFISRAQALPYLQTYSQNPRLSHKTQPYHAPDTEYNIQQKHTANRRFEMYAIRCQNREHNQVFHIGVPFSVRLLCMFTAWIVYSLSHKIRKSNNFEYYIS